MDKRAGPVAKISFERSEISVTGMKISPYYYTVNSKTVASRLAGMKV
jgi:hypothetical protein